MASALSYLGIHMIENAGMKHAVFSFLAVITAAAAAQQPVYLCGKTYTDKPCKDGKEVDIAPTRGAHSMSGQRRESLEAKIENMQRQQAEAWQKGVEQAQTINRCVALQQRRMQIDQAGQPEALKAERFKIREEQFQLKCRRT